MMDQRWGQNDPMSLDQERRNLASYLGDIYDRPWVWCPDAYTTAAVAQSNGFPYWTCLTGADTSIFRAMEIRDRWVNGVVSVRFAFVALTAGSGNVLLRCLLSKTLQEGQAIGAPTGTTIAAPVTAVSPTNLQFVETAVAAIPVTRDDDILQFQVQRRGSAAGDTYGGTIALLGWQILYRPREGAVE